MIGCGFISFIVPLSHLHPKRRASLDRAMQVPFVSLNTLARWLIDWTYQRVPVSMTCFMSAC